MKTDKRLLLLGGGGHCKSVADAARRMGCFSEIVITDPEIAAGTIVCGCEVAGGDDRLPELYAQGFRQAIVTVGSLKSTKIRRKLAAKAEQIGFTFVNVIDPSAVVSETAQIGNGVFIGKNAVVNADAVIGDHAIINTGAIVEHDCNVGAFAHVAVGATVCGGAEVGADTLIGANAVVLLYTTVGSGCVIGAGAVVNKSIPDNTTAVGVPARAIGQNVRSKNS